MSMNEEKFILSQNVSKSSLSYVAKRNHGHPALYVLDYLLPRKCVDYQMLFSDNKTKSVKQYNIWIPTINIPRKLVPYTYSRNTIEEN